MTATVDILHPDQPHRVLIVQGPFRAHAVRDGNLITGQQQYSGTAAGRLMITALGT